jgi:adenylate cyclase, class 2
VNSPQQSSIEVELKFRVTDQASLANRLSQIGAVMNQQESHRDLYFRHPCRDFVQTREALRIRRVTITRAGSTSLLEPAHESRVTYKGPHLPGGIKARHELEWPLNPSDPDGEQLQELLIRLGFEPVTTVVKQRQSLSLTREGREITVALDEVEQVGSYVEVEVLATGECDVPVARELVGRLAAELNLTEPESRSYLSLLLGKNR